jgi:hypothetical protein
MEIRRIDIQKEGFLSGEGFKIYFEHDSS